MMNAAMDESVNRPEEADFTEALAEHQDLVAGGADLDRLEGLGEAGAGEGLSREGVAVLLRRARSARMAAARPRPESPCSAVDTRQATGGHLFGVEYEGDGGPAGAGGYLGGRGQHVGR